MSIGLEPPSHITKTSALEIPEADAKAHSDKLHALLVQEIKTAGGRLPFHEYMQLALYAPGLGYYLGGQQKFGAHGDFITSPEVSTLFAGSLAHCWRSVQPVIAHAAILEVGAGQGSLAADLINALAQQNALPETYYILELSPELRERQQCLLAQRAGDYFSQIKWLDNIPAGFNGVVLANEVLDAMPVHRFKVAQQQILECYVSNTADGFVLEYAEPLTAALVQRVRDIEKEMAQPFADGYCSEINLAGEAWIRSLAQQLEQALVLLFDYGYPRHEYYHPQRRMGTMMCHYRHHAHDNVLWYPGLQDITAFVDFTAMAQAADEAGLDVAGYTTQAHFLLDNDILALVEAQHERDYAAYMRQVSELRRLTLPNEMGERFKVLALSRGFDREIPGFKQDLLGHL